MNTRELRMSVFGIGLMIYGGFQGFPYLTDFGMIILIIASIPFSEIIKRISGK